MSNRDDWFIRGRRTPRCSSGKLCSICSCSTDPTTIHLTQPTPLSRFSFSFYLYQILKEPIPFHIQCKLIHQDQSSLFSSTIDCSSFDSSTHPKAIFTHRNMKRNDVYTVFRSFPVYVARRIESLSLKDEFSLDRGKSTSVRSSDQRVFFSSLDLFSSTSPNRSSPLLLFFFLHLLLRWEQRIREQL